MQNQEEIVIIVCNIVIEKVYEISYRVTRNIFFKLPRKRGLIIQWALNELHFFSIPH